ncbi:unnamed protein product [Meganyctiphanes norvegica]|uniref:Transmembrane protein 19 n=1 Tax=Meganyctiphanes norvegica TaxID=48144 RepID=A0AAV2PZ22_MEGNR
MNGPRVQPAQWSRDALMLFLYCLPASLILWLVNTLRVNTLGGEVVEPMRWLGATCVPILVAWWGLKKRSLSLSGAFSGLFVGFILTVSSYVFMANLLVFFVTSSRATKYKAAQKKKLEMEFKEGGQRNWVQIICNGGVASFLAWLYIVDCGCGEHPIDLVYNYRCSWLAVAVLGMIKR